MDWYIPITILPGIGLLILSTSNQMIALSEEIRQRFKDEANEDVSLKKVAQLKLLNQALFLLYLAAGAMVFAGFLNGIHEIMPLPMILNTLIMLLGVISTLAALAWLIIYGRRAVNIRQSQFKNPY